MSSTTKGRDDWAREDDLDLGNDHNEDEQLPATAVDNGVVLEDGVNVDASAEELKDGSIAQVEEDIPDLSGHVQNEGDVDSGHVEAGGTLGNGVSSPSPLASPSLPLRPAQTGLGSPDGADDILSNPDDTPSLRGSLQSSPSGSALALRGSSPRPSPSPSHRPFDLRFQSRLSSSSLGSLRLSSPFLTQVRSRKSSLTSRLSPATIDSDPEGHQDPWEVVRWTKLRKITGQAFSEVGKRNFGSPTCMVVSISIVIGTARGIVLVFDYQQNLRGVIGQGTKAVECGAVQSLALSADHSTVAVGHISGDIFTWEVSRPARPFLHIQPIPSNQVETRTSDGHIAGSPVIHLGFLGTRRTALVSADKRGMAFSHLATRGTGSLGRTVKTTRILGRYPQQSHEIAKPRKPSSVLAFSPLPMGNVEQSTDSLGLVAMLTPYLLVIVSTTPVAQTQHKSSRPKEVAAHGAMTGALAWFPAIRLKGKDSQVSKTKLVYCWSNVLTVLDVNEVEADETSSKDRPPSLEFRPRCRWRADEAIVAVQWLSRSVLAVLTITQQLLIVEDHTMRVTNAVDLLNRHIYHVDLFSAQLHTLVEQLNEEDTSMHGVVADAFYMSFRSYKGRLFMLGYNEMLIGSLSNWADRLLAIMEAGDFIGAIRQATAYYSGNSEKLTVGLPDEDLLRQPIVREKLLEMISASLKYAFGRNAEALNDRLEHQQLEELAQVSISACVTMEDEDFLWDEVFDWYEEHQSQGVFLDALEPFIVEGTVLSLPPTAVKALINHFVVTHTASQLEEIICLLDTSTMDIDQVTTLCKQHNLYDAFIYVWSRCLGDYVGPLQELMGLIPFQQPATNGDAVNDITHYTNAMKIFPYLSFVFTSRSYPTGNDMDDAEASKAKAALYDYIFSGTYRSSSALAVLLKFDTSSFMSMLNEAFEDNFLNGQDPDEAPQQGVSVNRQYLISILLQTMASTSFETTDTIYLDMFIARNLPKYPQYILLSGSTLHQVLERLCRYPSEEMAEDCELSAEYLLSIYHPPDIQQMIPLFREAKFFRILKSTYRSEKQYLELVLTYLEDPSERMRIFTCLQDCLRPGANLGKKQRQAVLSAIEAHALEISAIDVRNTAQIMRDYAPESHETFIKVLQDDSYSQYQYLSVIVEHQMQSTVDTERRIENWMVERYVQLLCKHDPNQVANFVDTIREGDIRLDELLPAMEESGVVDAAVILLARQGQVRAAMDRLIAHLKTLESGLVGILQSVEETPDSATTAEAIEDLLESLNKYTKVGTWLCQGQSKTAKNSGRIEQNGGGKNTMEQLLSFDEELWLDLLEGVVRIASSVFSQIQGGIANREEMTEKSTSPLGANATQLVSSFRTLVQQTFTILLSSTVRTSGSGPATGERNDVAFLRILRAFLTRAARWSPSLLELRAVLASVFSAYTYEKSLLSLANGMLDRDLFVHVDEVTRLRQKGWRPRGQVCEICRQRIWGPGVGPQHWAAWETRQTDLKKHRLARQLEARVDPASARGKGKETAAVSPADHGSGHMDHPHAMTTSDSMKLDDHNDEGTTSAAPGPVVVFSCRHLYHRQCLIDIGQSRPARQRQHYGEWEVLVCPVCPPVHSE